MSGAMKPIGAAELRQFKPYPDYKDSGVDWLGQIPAHWDVRRLKYLANLNPQSLAEDTDPTREMVYVDIGGVDSLGRITEREPLTFASAPSRARRVVHDGDVIVSTVRTYLRAIAPIRDPEPGMIVSTGFAVVRPTRELTTDYAAYALRAPYFVERVVANSKGVSFPAINESEMATYEVAVPPEHEQRSITAFLDKETAKVDASIAKKEQLIALLQEKRTALITRAVTKGLDPSVPMKDSGIEWLGAIPAHWEVKNLKRIAKRVDVGIAEAATHAYADGGVPIIRTTNVRANRLLTDDLLRIERWFADKNRSKYLLAGDLVTARTGVPGTTAVIPQELDHSQCFTMLITTLRKGYVPAFFSYYLNSTVARVYFDLEGWGSAQTNISVPILQGTPVPVPPEHEQKAIVAHIETHLAPIDNLSSMIQGANDRLKEMRTALVSAAVSGKIDVREELG